MKYLVTQEAGMYKINYTFQDIFSNLQQYNLNFPIEPTDCMIDRFGIPKWMFEPYEDNEINHYLRQQELNRGLFQLRGNIIEVDKSAVIEYYAEFFCQPIAQMIARSLDEYGADNPRNRIEFTMRFVQDIPYGVPKFDDRERHYGGVSPPPKLLIEGFGDCDSKVILFAGILSYLIDPNDFLFLNQTDHVLAAVREKPQKGLTFVRYQGAEYLIAEIAGPGMRMLGQKGTYYRDQFEAESLHITPRGIIPAGSNTNTRLQTDVSDPQNGKSIIIRNNSTREIRFQLNSGFDQWEQVLLGPYQTTKFTPKAVGNNIIRYPEKSTQLKTVKLTPGQVYQFNWSSRAKKWELTVS